MTKQDHNVIYYD